MSITRKPFGIFWQTVAYALILTRSSPRDCEMALIYRRTRLCRGPNSEKVKIALSLELSGISWWNFAYTLILTRCSPRDCEMPFGIDRGFAEVQVLKRWTWPYLLNLLVYFDNVLHTHYYWQDLDRAIARYNLWSTEAMPRSKFWKKKSWNMEITHFGM